MSLLLAITSLVYSDNYTTRLDKMAKYDVYIADPNICNINTQGILRIIGRTRNRLLEGDLVRVHTSYDSAVSCFITISGVSGNDIYFIVQYRKEIFLQDHLPTLFPQYGIINPYNFVCYGTDITKRVPS